MDGGGADASGPKVADLLAAIEREVGMPPCTCRLRLGTVQVTPATREELFYRTLTSCGVGDGDEVDLQRDDEEEPEVPPLHFAAMVGSTRVMERWLASGADVDELDVGDLTALMRAVEGKVGGVATMDLLLRWGADVNAANRAGNTALHLAACRENVEAVRWLAVRADVDTRNVDGETPLHVAVATWVTLEVVGLLVASGAAVFSRDGFGVSTFDSLLEPVGCYSRSRKPREARAPRIMRWLMTRMAGAAVDDQGVPLLHSAVAMMVKGESTTSVALDVFGAMLACGADICALDPDGNTVLHVAVLRGQPPIVEWLAARMPPDLPASDGQTPLHFVAVSKANFFDRARMVEILVAAGADLDRTDRRGVSARKKMIARGVRGLRAPTSGAAGWHLVRVRRLPGRFFGRAGGGWRR